MRASDAILSVIKEVGAVAPHQFNIWILKLIDSGYIEASWEGDDGDRQPVLRLTEKGQAYAAAKKL